ncbi:MAG: hypothetical protein WDA09_10000 [Bacteriovoracaceae bacterium]
MKSILISAATLLLSQSAIATTCYVPEENSYDFIPTELCFDFLYLDTQRNEVILKEINGLLPTVLHPQYVARRNENGFRFISTYEKINHWPGGCTEGKQLNLIIEGQSDNDGYVDENYLKIKGRYSYNWDDCHGKLEEGEITYKLK